MSVFAKSFFSALFSSGIFPLSDLKSDCDWLASPTIPRLQGKSFPYRIRHLECRTNDCRDRKSKQKKKRKFWRNIHDRRIKHNTIYNNYVRRTRLCVSSSVSIEAADSIAGQRNNSMSDATQQTNGQTTRMMLRNDQSNWIVMLSLKHTLGLSALWAPCHYECVQKRLTTLTAQEYDESKWIVFG